MATIVPILNSIDGAVTSSEVFLVRLSSQGCVNLDGKRPRFLRSPKKRKRRISPNRPGPSCKHCCKVSEDDMAKFCST